MIVDWLPSFLDEVEKVAVELTPGQQHRQAAQYTALGAVAAPAVGVVKNVIEHGKAFSPGAHPIRQIAAQATGGAILTGAVPVIRHHIEQKNIQHAIKQRRTARAGA